MGTRHRYNGKESALKLCSSAKIKRLERGDEMANGEKEGVRREEEPTFGDKCLKYPGAGFVCVNGERTASTNCIYHPIFTPFSDALPGFNELVWSWPDIFKGHPDATLAREYAQRSPYIRN